MLVLFNYLGRRPRPTRPSRPRPSRRPRPTRPPPPGEGSYYEGAGQITSRKMLTTFSEISPYFKLKTTIRINSDVGASAELWQFTTGEPDSRIPAIIQTPGKKLEIWYPAGYRHESFLLYTFDFELVKAYTIELSQTRSRRNTYYVSIGILFCT